VKEVRWVPAGSQQGGFVNRVAFVDTTTNLSREERCKPQSGKFSPQERQDISGILNLAKSVGDTTNCGLEINVPPLSAPFYNIVAPIESGDYKGIVEGDKAATIRNSDSSYPVLLETDPNKFFVQVPAVGEVREPFISLESRPIEPFRFVRLGEEKTIGFMMMFESSFDGQKYYFRIEDAQGRVVTSDIARIIRHEAKRDDWYPDFIKKDVTVWFQVFKAGDYKLRAFLTDGVVSSVAIDITVVGPTATPTATFTPTSGFSIDRPAAGERIDPFPATFKFSGLCKPGERFQLRPFYASFQCPPDGRWILEKSISQRGPEFISLMRNYSNESVGHSIIVDTEGTHTYSLSVYEDFRDLRYEGEHLAGAKVPLAAQTKRGYLFRGWYILDSGSHGREEVLATSLVQDALSANTELVMPAGDVRIYALYSAIDTVTPTAMPTETPIATPTSTPTLTPTATSTTSSCGDGTLPTIGADWIGRETERSWQSITSSSDGTKLAAVGNWGQIYTSTDSGVSWTPRESYRRWQSITSSSDGKMLAAVVEGGQIYTSTDSGVTWTARESNRNWGSITSSSDGTKLAAVEHGGQIYTSTDSGVSWTARESNRNWVSITSSSDGTKLAAVEYPGQIYTSTDSGVTWTARESNRGWNSITSSSDGTKLAAVVGGGQIYTSVDYGANWTPRGPTGRWIFITSSSDGANLAAVSNGRIYTSVDYGANWTRRESYRNWQSLAYSSDGAKLAAVAYGGQIYTSAFEQCDDGNPYPGDGCSNTCAVESGYSCSGTPSVCAISNTPPVG
jgi:cysteine-rich repeat protein